MALPASWTSVNLTGTFTNSDGTPVSGDIYIKSDQAVVIGGEVIVPVE